VLYGFPVVCFSSLSSFVSFFLLSVVGTRLIDATTAVCENVGVSRVPVDNASSAYLMQSTWMKSALNDPCLFHATLFAGSSCFDLLRTEKQSPITLFHQTEAIRIINQRLSNPTWALKDSTILAITPLALFSVSLKYVFKHE
jgi:hypothetical protein